MKKILGVLIVFGIVLAFANMGAMAYFFDTEISDNNSLQSGTYWPISDTGCPYYVKESETVTLDEASGSDPDSPNSSLDYEWKITKDPTGQAEFLDKETVNPVFKALDVLETDTIIKVKLTVTDVDGFSDSDTAKVFVTSTEDSTPAVVKVKPDTLNKNSKAGANSVTAYIELPNSYNVSNIQPETVNLMYGENKVDALTTQPSGNVGDFDEDGNSDMKVKFDRQDVIENLVETVSDENIQLTLTGKINSSETVSFTGCDNIKVIEPGGSNSGSSGNGGES